jgi:hypothetical protein
MLLGVTLALLKAGQYSDAYINEDVLSIKMRRYAGALSEAAGDPVNDGPRLFE